MPDKANLSPKILLIEPQYYVLELIQSAVASGASYIDITLNFFDFIIQFDGESFNKQEIENLFRETYILPGEKNNPQLFHMAVALRTARDMGMDLIEIESGNGKDNLKAIIKSDGEIPFEDSGEKMMGSRIHIRDRFNLRTVERFIDQSLFGKFPREGELIREKCIFCPIPIKINGKIVNPEEDMVLKYILYQAEINEGGISGIIAVPKTPYKLSHLQFVTWGVLINSRHLELILPPIIGFIRDNDLAKNISQSDIIENGEYQRVLEIIKSNKKKLVSGLTELFASHGERLDHETKEQIKNRLLEAGGTVTYSIDRSDEKQGSIENDRD